MVSMNGDDKLGTEVATRKANEKSRQKMATKNGDVIFQREI